MKTNICKGLNKAAKIIHSNNKEKGFYDNQRNVGEMLMLVVTELSEALEAHRKERFMYEHDKANLKLNPTFENIEFWYPNVVKGTFEEEIADTFIRLLDLSAYLGIDIETHIQLKVEYNKTRERLHGKTY